MTQPTNPSTTRQETTLGDRALLDWLRLSRTENVGPITFYKLLETYGSAGRALEAIPALAGRGTRKKALAIPPAAQIEKEIAAAAKKGARLIAACEAAYPIPLGAIDDAPPVLTVMGDASLLNRASIGIVGARNASQNGCRFAETLARDLGKAGQIVVSGLARGIDTAAHQGALDTGTIAVVAGGIDVVYPPENEKLHRAIAERGLIVAENPFGTAPRASDFPRRNRIISGLSQAVAVVEATERSGSLITARFAAEQGRDVYAVPGHPHDPRASGPNRLIRDGAILLRGATDILQDMREFRSATFPPEAPPRGLSDRAQEPGRPMLVPPAAHRPAPAEDAAALDDIRAAVTRALSYSPVSVDELVRACGAPASHVQVILLDLELSGLAQRLPGNRIVRLREDE